MNTLTIERIDATASDVDFTDDLIIVYLADGRIINVPLEWYPRLAKATKKQLKNWRFIGGGIGIHWKDIDEDISVEGLMKFN